MSALESALRGLMKRRSFVAKLLGLFALGSIPQILTSRFVVHRIVSFPYPMTFDHYESLGRHYCDSPAITRFCDQMRARGELISITHKFSERKIEYTLVFRDAQAYDHYLNTINQNWLNYPKFVELGFKVEMNQVPTPNLLQS